MTSAPNYVDVYTTCQLSNIFQIKDNLLGKKNSTCISATVGKRKWWALVD